METQIRYVTGRTARARIRGGQLVVTMPRHWPRSEQDATLAKFTRWAQKHAQSLRTLPPPEDMTPVSLDALTALVAQINRETLNVPYHGVRIGRSRYTRLAQVNLKTRVLTFSRFAINGLPPRALRYLILHELSHLIVPNHSAKFWALVGRYEPDYRNQRAIAQNHYQRMAAVDEPPTTLPLLAAGSAPTVSAPAEAAPRKQAKKDTGRDKSRPVQLSLFSLFQ